MPNTFGQGVYGGGAGGPPGFNSYGSQGSGWDFDSSFGGGLKGFMPDLGPAMQQQGNAFAKDQAKQKFGFDEALLNEQLGAQKGLAQMETQAGNYRAQLAANASMYPYQIKSGQFDRIFPYITQSLGQDMKTIGGTPEITRGGVYNPQQIQQQVNQSNAGTDASTAAQNRQTSSSLAGRGFGANSPLAAMLASGNQQAALQTKVGNETGIRQGAAKLNADQLLSSQNAYEQASQARAKPYFQQQSALLSLLGAFA